MAQAAVVVRERVKRSPGKPAKYGHFCEAEAKDCVLLPTTKRTFRMPVQKTGGLGRSNVCYALDTKGNQKPSAWVAQTTAYVDDYQGPNSLIDPEDLIGNAISGGQGLGLTAAQRRAVELLAMNRATYYFQKKQFDVLDVSRTRSYDLECKKGSKVVHVEVNGTTTRGSQVLLTKNEVKHAQDPRYACALFILHSVELNNSKAIGGTIAIRWPWKLDDAHLQPITYIYQLELKDVN